MYKPFSNTLSFVLRNVTHPERVAVRPESSPGL